MIGIKHIINEELNKFINELKEHNDNDIINTKDIDLQNEYIKLNKELFNNELPEVPLKWSHRKGNLGHVNAMINRRTNEIKINHLAISTFYTLNYRQFKDTMAHEMIHVKQLAGGNEGSHGRSFMEEADRINRMGLGYKITIKNDEPLNVADVDKNRKTVIAVIFEINNQNYVIVTTVQAYRSEGFAIENYFQKMVNNGRFNDMYLVFIESNNAELAKYKINRSLRRSFSYGKLSDELYEKLLNDKVINEIKIEKNNSGNISENEWEDISISEGEWEDISIS